jgi:hypothetical protein
MAAQAWFTANEIEVEPGTSVFVQLTVANLGQGTESFSLTPTGLPAAYTTIRPGYITLFGGSQETVQVEISAPRLASTTAGPTALGVRVVPQADPDDVQTAEITLQIHSTFDRRIVLLQPAIRTRRRAVFELMVENQGNAQASCRMHLIDPTTRLDGDFDPPAVGVEPGGNSLVRLKIKATRAQWDRRSRSIPFRVEADQQGAPTAEARGSFIQAPVIPERLWGRLGWIAASIVALGAVWVGVIRPAIDDAARDAVAEVGPVEVAPSTTVESVSTTTTVPSTPTPPAGGGVEGEPFSRSLPSGATEGQTSTRSVAAPPGQALDITDLVVDNPFGEEGIATVRVGLLTFPIDLAEYSGFSWSQRWFTPLRLNPGEEVVFDVNCSRVGRPGAATCDATLTISGRLVDLDG